MADYIEREAAIAAAFSATSLGNSAFRDVYDTVNRLRLIPAADVRPVVLCKDCVHYEMGVCLKIYDDGATNKDAWQERKPDDFCSRGEKREES